MSGGAEEVPEAVGKGDGGLVGGEGERVAGSADAEEDLLAVFGLALRDVGLERGVEGEAWRELLHWGGLDAGEGGALLGLVSRGVWGRGRGLKGGHTSCRRG